MGKITQETLNKAWNDNFEDFRALIRIPSVYDEETVTSSMPCGKAVNDALLFMRSLCEREGFKIKDYDGHAFSASYGSGDRVDIVSHLDVVAVDSDWDDDPFSGKRKDGRVYGRGTQDMKSGAFITFLALKILKDNGIVPLHEIRLVYGTDEERTMDDMRYYVEKEGLPAFAFSPDGRFPMAIGEKGALMWIMEGDFASKVQRLNIGIQPNVIPPFAEAEVSIAGNATGTDATGMDAICTSEKFVTEGKAAHASRPEDGDSAGTKMFKLLYEKTGEDIWKRLYEAFSDPFGKGCGFDSMLPEDDGGIFAMLTVNPGIVSFERGNNSGDANMPEDCTGHFKAMIDCRYPMGVSSLDLTDKLAKLFPDFSVTLPYDDPPSMADPQSEYVKLLKGAYKMTTGKTCEPFVSGGVSYSKVFGNCVTFGTVAEDSESLAHQRNESISESDCLEALEIYLKFIAAL